MNITISRFTKLSKKSSFLFVLLYTKIKKYTIFAYIMFICYLKYLYKIA